MKTAQRTFQNILIESRNVPWLPPLWQVIYSEGIRGNHLLFDKLEVEAFDRTRQLTLTHRMTADGDTTPSETHLEDVVLQLTCCADLSSMIKVVSAQNFETKANLFQLYLRTLDLWKNLHRTRSN